MNKKKRKAAETPNNNQKQQQNLQDSDGNCMQIVKKHTPIPIPENGQEGKGRGGKDTEKEVLYGHGHYKVDFLQGNPVQIDAAVTDWLSPPCSPNPRNLDIMLIPPASVALFGGAFEQLKRPLLVFPRPVAFVAALGQTALSFRDVLLGDQLIVVAGQAVSLRYVDQLMGGAWGVVSETCTLRMQQEILAGDVVL